VLYDGEIVEEGATASVLDGPTHAYSQRLVESLIT
jgi:ABC-type dipeptide/oligopeptide/nickel transport system ATPase component